ncbi:MAG TPA: hypothetical protein VHB25_03465 [Gemmatimonadaceae bacterium]|nr:hypothetical protein [Gemmatimonadaceae bacterium]
MRTGFSSIAVAMGVLSAAGCASSHAAATAAPTPTVQQASSSDARVGLSAGWWNAGEAIWNLKKVSENKPAPAFLPKSPAGLSLANSDLTFTGHYAIQGNFSGYTVWDIANPEHPTVADAYVCRGSQSDVSVYRNLLFVSGEELGGRLDCGIEGVTGTVSPERLRGIRIFDISDITHPKYIANVQTCRGSHTHTVVTDPNDPNDVYIYVSGSAPVRPAAELAGCSGATPQEDPNSELFRIEVIQVPLAHPEQAHVISKPDILANLGPAEHHGETPADVAAAAKLRAEREAAAAAAGRPAPAARPVRPATGPVQCHDITVYPSIGLAGGACAGYGVLLDIHDPAHPRRLYAASDTNFSFWHSATFSNDGSKVLFSDEWGGGTQPRCRATDDPHWGADAIFTIDQQKLDFDGYYKLPAPQTSTENCVAHNGSLIPVPGRDIMAQAWYQGGLSVFDWTDPAHPREIAYFDRGPMNKDTLYLAGYWSAYWYNGHIYGSEIARGLDVFDLTPSPLLSQNEIDAAKLVHFDQLNVQDQPKLVWPAAFVVARAYVDQLTRDGGLSKERIVIVSDALARAEKASGAERTSVLAALATQLDNDASSSSDAHRVKLLASEVRALAAK